MKKLLMIFILSIVGISVYCQNSYVYPFIIGKVSKANGKITLVGSTSGSSDIQVNATGALSLPATTFTNTITFPYPFTLGATSVTATGANLNAVPGVIADLADYVTGVVMADSNKTSEGNYATTKYVKDFNGYAKIYTAKIIIGTADIGGCDFNFTAPSNGDHQDLDCGAIIPALSRVLAVEVVCMASLVSSSEPSDISIMVGNWTDGDQFIATTSAGVIDDAGEIVGISDGTKLPAVPMYAGVTHLWFRGDPDDNWDILSHAHWNVYVTYILYE